MFINKAQRTPVVALFALASLAVTESAAAQSNAPRRAGVDTIPAIRLDTLLDLQTVIRRALAVNPAAAQGEAGVRTARSGERVALGAYVPSITATSSALRSNVVTPGGLTVGSLPTNDDSYTAGLSSSLDLYTGGRRGADRARAEADTRAAESNRVSQRYAVTLLATGAFFEALRSSELVVVARARVATADRGLRFARDRVQAGTGTLSDELRARLESTGGQQQLVAALDTLQAAAFSLGRLVGAEGPIGARPPESLEPRPLALADSDVVRLAVEASPSVRAAAASANASDAAIRSARTQYVPNLRATGGYNWANQSRLLSAVRPGWALVVGTSYPLFNGFQREDAIERAEAASDVARVVAVDERRSARSEAARLLGALRLAERNIGLAEESVQASQEDLRVQTDRFRAGLSTTLDLLTSELAVTQARLALVAARHNYQLTRATLEALVGRPL